MTIAADLIARRLYEAGCRHAFGIPGGEVLTLMDSLNAAGIKFVLTKHENNAAYMAQGVYHATGAPGILVTTVGPGMSNAVNAIANAEQERVPMIFLTGCVDADEAVTYTHQTFDHQAVIEPLVKATFRAVDGAIDAMIDKAVAIAMDDQPGPVHVDVPIAVAATEQPDAPPVRRAHPSPMAPAPGPDLDQAREWLAKAERPLMIAGLDPLRQGGSEAVASLAMDFNIPLITTYNAKGILPEDHPLCVGSMALSPLGDKKMLPLVKEADLVILAGYDPIEMRPGWKKAWADDARVIEFSAAPNTHYYHHVRMTFIGDVGAGLKVLRSGLEPHPTWPGGEAAVARALLRETFPTDEEWGPAAVVDAVRKVLPRDGIACCDTGAHRILLNQTWECYAPGTLLQSMGLGSMGCALGLAMGHKIADPEHAVVAFQGDACMEMVLGELATLRDLKLAIPLIVFVDESLALIELKQRNMQLANVGVDFGGTDFPAVARALGGIGVVAGDRASLATAMEEALAADTFTIIACPIGRQAYNGRI